MHETFMTIVSISLYTLINAWARLAKIKYRSLYLIPCRNSKQNIRKGKQITVKPTVVVTNI